MKTNLSSLKIAVVALGILFSKTASAQFTAVTSGNWSNSATWGGTAPTSTVSGQNITIPSGITVTLDADVTFTGLVNTFMVNGILTSTTSNAAVITSGALSGTGTVSIGKMVFSLLGTSTFAGTLNVKHLKNTTPSLSFGAIANISDTLDLESGNILLNTNSNLSMSAGSTVKVDNGSLVVNAGIFNSGNTYNVMYIGSTKTSGIELNTTTLQNVYVKLSSNSEKVTLANNTIINGNLNMTSGNLVIFGKKLTLKGDLMSSTGTTIGSDNNSDLVIEGTGNLSTALMFANASGIHDLTINRASGGMVKLQGPVVLIGQLNLMDGNLSIENTGTLTMSSNTTVHVEKGNLTVNSGSFVATSAYSVEYTGASNSTAGAELSGSGLNNVKVNYGLNTTKVTLNSNASIAGKFELTKGKIDLNGKNLILNGTLDQTADGWFIGNSASELHLNLTSVNGSKLMFDNATAASQTLSKLKINTSGVNTIVLGSKLIIGSELTFVAGKIELGNGDLEILPSASIVGYDDTKYIITSENSTGVLIQNVNSGSVYVVYPVGLYNNYSPAYVQQTSAGTSGNFSVKCHSLYITPTLKAVNRKWMVESMNVTTVNANLKFSWKSSEELNSFDRTNAYVSHYTNSTWDVTSSSSATLAVNGNYELSRTGLTSLSPFAVVENGQPLGVKEVTKLEGVELYPNPSKEVLNIKVLNTTNNYSYELVDLTGRVVLSTVNNNSLNKFDVSSLSSGCYFIKITNLNDNRTDTKRFIKQ